jgi:hypothetical protein
MVFPFSPVVDLRYPSVGILESIQEVACSGILLTGYNGQRSIGIITGFDVKVFKFDLADSRDGRGTGVSVFFSQAVAKKSRSAGIDLRICFAFIIIDLERKYLLLLRLQQSHKYVSVIKGKCSVRVVMKRFAIEPSALPG